MKLQMDMTMHLISMSELVACRGLMYIRLRIDSMTMLEMCIQPFLSETW